MSRPVVTFLVIVAALVSPGAGQTSLQVRPAWGNKDRAARWNALLVRAADPIPRNVTLQLLAPETGGFATILQERLAIGPTPATFEIFAPIHPGASQHLIAVLRDAATGKFLAQFPKDLLRPTPTVAAVGAQSLFIGITGISATFDQLSANLGADFGYLPEHQLPRSPTGYDSLDALILNRPRLPTLDSDQQHALLDWVRAGGSLLFTPGDDTPARDSPFASALPCRIGDVNQLDLPPQALSDLHLSPRFARVAVRALDPAPDVQRVALFNGNITGYCRRFGLGQILVVPFDIRALEANDPADRPAVVAEWRTILAALIRLPKPPTDTPRFAAPYNGVMSESPEQFREGAATATACDFLSPAGPPQRTWPHVTLVLLGLFLVAGPLDCIVLKLTGQSPWTWTTMVGWIACFVLAGLYTASRLAKPPATFATLRLVDQCDDATVATTDLIASHLPTESAIAPSPAEAPPGWWEVALPGAVIPGSIPTQPDISFHASDEGCTPLPVPPTGDTQFFRRQLIQSAGPLIKARLSLAGNGPAARIIGTIQNISSNPLTNLRLRTAAGVIPITPGTSGSLAPGQSVSIAIPAAGEAFSPAKYEGRYQNFGSWGSRRESAAVREQDLWAVVPDLAARRSLKIDALFESNSPVACLYAQSVGPPPIAQPAGKVALKSYEWVRVLIPMARQPI